MASATPNREVPVIQILEKERYFTQALVPVASALPYPPLPPSSLRIRTRVLGLSVNNFTYAKLGFLFHWWDIHPLPPSTPAPYDDATKYGRISGWGWAEVQESTHTEVPPGSFIWGYQAIGTLAQDLAVRSGEAPDQIMVTSEYRQHIMPIYNRYVVAKGAAAEAVRREIDNRSSSVAYDALARIMFETAYLMNRYALGAPAALPSAAAPGTALWTAEHANIKGATIISLAPGSKAGLSFAHELRHARGEGERPRQVVGAASDVSLAFVDGTGLYDAVASTAESPIEVLEKLGVGKDEKIVLVDFGGRGNAAVKWATALLPTYKNFLMLTVGGEIAEQSPADVLAGFQSAGFSSTVVNAGDLREQALKIEGEAKYFGGLQHAWESLRKDGFKGVEVRWGTGMDDVKAAWDELASGKAKPHEGLAFVL